MFHLIKTTVLPPKLKMLCFPQKLSRGRQWVRQSTLHCTTEAMTIHNDQSSIKRICMTLKCMCISIISLMFLPYILFVKDNKKQQCSPYVFLHDDQRKTTMLPPMFYLMNIDSLTPYVYFMMADKKRQLRPHVFSMLTNKKRQCYPLCIFFMTANKKRQCYPLCFFSWRPIQNDSVNGNVFFHDGQ